MISHPSILVKRDAFPIFSVQSKTKSKNFDVWGFDSQSPSSENNEAYWSWILPSYKIDHPSLEYWFLTLSCDWSSLPPKRPIWLKVNRCMKNKNCSLWQESRKFLWKLSLCKCWMEWERRRQMEVQFCRKGWHKRNCLYDFRLKIDRWRQYNNSFWASDGSKKLRRFSWICFWMVFYRRKRLKGSLNLIKIIQVRN